MGKKSRQKRMRRNLRPAPVAAPGRRAGPRSNAKAKVMKLLEAMVDAAQEDLTSGAEKPRVSYGQALRAGELLVRYEAEEREAAEPVSCDEPEASFGIPELGEDEEELLMNQIREEVAAINQTAQTG